MITDQASDGGVVLAEAESALECGESERAFDLLEQARQLGVAPTEFPRFASAYGMAARYVNRQAEVLRWLEGEISRAAGPERARFLAARIAVCRQVDVQRVISLADEALQMADSVGDVTSYASVLAHAAFAAYRLGDGEATARIAALAQGRGFGDASAQFDALRARMFAATARGDAEQSLELSRSARDLALQLGRRADGANESNNIAEILLDLGRPTQAEREASFAAELAHETGHRPVELFARVLGAVATAELGEIDSALERLSVIEVMAVHRMLAVDAAAAEAFWLLERGAAGDADRARQVALAAVELATATGVANRITTLHSQVARCDARQARPGPARAALTAAQTALARAAPGAVLQLALACTEVFAVSDPQRRAALCDARNRLLRSARRCRDPRAYCTQVRLHRRLLELSGGVPGEIAREP
jgi:tetratricopeptide (TPR) repeat protein